MAKKRPEFTPYKDENIGFVDERIKHDAELLAHGANSVLDKKAIRPRLQLTDNQIETLMAAEETKKLGQEQQPDSSAPETREIKEAYEALERELIGPFKQLQIEIKKCPTPYEALSTIKRFEVPNNFLLDTMLTRPEVVALIKKIGKGPVNVYDPRYQGETTGLQNHRLAWRALLAIDTNAEFIMVWENETTH